MTRYYYYYNKDRESILLDLEYVAGISVKNGILSIRVVGAETWEALDIHSESYQNFIDMWLAWKAPATYFATTSSDQTEKQKI
jgi:hypothetical protein